MNLVYMNAGFMPQVTCSLKAATNWVSHAYEGSITFNDAESRFYCDSIPTRYYWENDILLREIKK